MKKILSVAAILIAVAASIFLSFSESWYAEGNALAEKGSITIDGENLDDEILRLSTLWEYYEGELLTPKSFEGESKPVPTGYINPLGTIISDCYDKPLAISGAKTFRVFIKGLVPGRTYGISLDNVRAASAIYIDGKFAAKSGVPAVNMADYTSGKRLYFAFFTATEKPTEVLLQVANFETPFEGLSYDITISHQQYAANKALSLYATEISGMALCFFLGVYYILIFFSNKEQKRYFFVSGQMLSLALVYYINGIKVVNDAMYSFGYVFFLRIQSLALLSLGVFTALIILKTYEDMLSRAVSRMFIGFSAVCAVLTLFHSSGEISWIYAVSQFVFVLYLLYCVIAMVLIMGEQQKRSSKFIRIDIFMYTLLCIGQLVRIMWEMNIAASRQISMTALMIFAVLSQFIPAIKFLENINSMKHMDKVKDDFIIGSSYRVKAPITTIQSLSAAALDASDSVRRSALEDIHGIAREVSGEISAILSVSALDGAAPSSSAVPSSLFLVVEMVLEEFRHNRPEYFYRFRNSIDKSIYAQIDSSILRKILSSIFALCAEECGEVLVYARQSFGKAEICIEPHGGKAGNLFMGRFGSGFSLTLEGRAISRVLSRLGGGFTADTRAGIIKIILPLAYRAQKHDIKSFMSSVGSTHSDDPSLAPLGVLVADSEAVDIMAVQAILSHRGYNVFGASDLKTAREIIKKEKIHLAIISEMLSDGLGTELCAEIRKSFSSLELPVLLSVVSASEDDLEIAAHSGFNDFIKKPFDKSELAARTKNLTSLKELTVETAKSELAFARAQIRPHFLHNAINTIVSFCYTDGEAAARLLTDLSQYLRYSFDFDPQNDIVTLGKEIGLVKAFADIQSARFSNRINIEYDIEKASGALVPAFCIQPLVENSIKHGFDGENPLNIKVSAETTDQSLVITVADDGRGISAERLAEIEADNNCGIGIKSVRKRLADFYGGSLEISGGLGLGTTVRMEMKIIPGGDGHKSDNS